MSRIIDELKRTDHKRYLGGLDFFIYWSRITGYCRFY